MQMNTTAGAPMMQAHINHQLSADEEIDKYETSNDFSMGNKNSNTIRVKQYIPPQPRERQRQPSNDNVDMARYEESAGDLASVKDRITVYDQSDRFGLRELAQTTSFLDEKSSYP